MDSLKKARALYESMDFREFAEPKQPGSYTMADGKMRASVVYKTCCVEVLHGMCDPDCKIETHTHEQIENVLLYKGDLTLYIEGEDAPKQLRISENVSVPAHKAHHLVSKHGCQFLLARIPPIEDVY